MRTAKKHTGAGEVRGSAASDEAESMEPEAEKERESDEEDLAAPEDRPGRGG
jgi:hypothetical protein